MTIERRALVVRGGWAGHEPVKATELFIPYLRERGFAVQVADSPAPYADAGLMARTDLVVQCVTMATIAPEEVAGLVAAVAAGTGLAGWHGGIADSYRASADYLQLVGGQFAAHAARCGPAERTGDQSDNYVRHRITLTPAAAGHPVTAGLADFDLDTEQYWVLTDDLNDVLATTTTAVRPWAPWQRPVTAPAVWTRQWGRGRVFVATPGHTVEVLEEPTVRTIVERGLLWASR
ncbi:ThuA domain-containing protein [Actinoplanes sp. NPDC049599]|uniref:ThuA domain-containing protein n=1 Tax=Actinoplanes sp. NPDC049599 TaxID=3363903 RepID=UPI0037B7A0FF